MIQWINISITIGISHFQQYSAVAGGVKESQTAAYCVTVGHKIASC